MFFKLLKLAGLDVNEKIAELKAELAFKAEQASEHVTHKARALAMVAGLLWLRRNHGALGSHRRSGRALQVG
jgi:hypothetical protein